MKIFTQKHKANYTKDNIFTQYESINLKNLEFLIIGEHTIKVQRLVLFSDEIELAFWKQIET
ncbi:hypothetical protein BpHYR1_052381 [Brachionus plicatilis]|uniref:Uncharacterized protein n=1 Tax=Brachionus plicatilis TaxID=10195 RepID=A0A3M7RV69_BRAPC|nr:hypothetical protein BpHYR1_052381 [Brachionus plicatilis]